MRLGKQWIARRIPQQGSMCLLDEVTWWDAGRILCRAGSHHNPGNPLRAHGRLATVCGIEFAAQAMAVHGVLTAGADASAMRPRMGFLVSVRGVEMLVDRLDDIAADLEVEAERLAGDGNHILYTFAIRAEGRLLLSGRAAVVLDAGQTSGHPS
jgi:predicted hotdog family 3-hydroxylacyl-ACP dehydratase